MKEKRRKIKRNRKWCQKLKIYSEERERGGEANKLKKEYKKETAFVKDMKREVENRKRGSGGVILFVTVAWCLIYKVVDIKLHS